MFARNVTLHVKPNQAKEVAQKFEKDILPILRKANGFRDQLTMSRNPDETVGISLWNNKAELDAYTRDTDPQVVKLLEPFITGSPEVRTYEVSGSTSHKYVLAA
jgi:quinol monooxygenase YgiN